MVVEKFASGLEELDYFYIFGNMEKNDALAALGALAQETRLDIFRLLVRFAPDGLAAGQIGTTLGLAAATLSFHLKEMRHAGLLRCDRDGRSLRYSADLGAMTGLIGYLTQNCCDQSSGCDLDIPLRDAGAAPQPERRL
jgi:DNA-binding transcriptional ArsR family regulator